MQESYRLFDCIDFTPNKALDKLLSGFIENRATKNEIDCILHIRIELVNGVVESGSGSVDPAKDAVINCSLDVVDPGVDSGGVECGLVVHTRVDVCCDEIIEVGNS